MSIGESLTFDYDLPNDTNYSETCASVGLVFFAHRMLQIDPDRQYSDVMERALYNTVISGMSLDGKKFFYVNPLEVWPEACEKNKVKSHVKYTRQPWFGCACCPPNIARLLTSLGKYIYSKKDKEIFVHLYVGSELKEKISENQVSIRQSTQYPWDEKIDIEVDCEKETEFALSLRIPGWCKEAKIKVNNEEIDLNSVMAKGYAKINRIWKHEKVEVYLSMPVMRIKANPNVREDEGKVAIQRGPIVYCLEEVDNGKNLNNIVLPTDSKFEIKKDKDLNDVCVIETDAFREKYEDWNDELYKSDVKVSYEKTRIRFVPYFAWANRTPGEMEVWVREK